MALSSVMTGIAFSNRLKKRVNICDELVSFCDMLCVDISCSRTPIKALLSRILSDDAYKNLDFISFESVISNTPLKSCLSNKDNEALSSFLYSLGKYDSKRQIELISSFKSYITLSKSDYYNAYLSKSKVYISMGICCGLVVLLSII